MIAQPARIMRYSAAIALADMRAIYSWKSWTFGWLIRMLAQVTFFTLIGKLIAEPGELRFLVLGNALMTCALEAMMVVASSTWERAAGTLPLLIASPAGLTWIFVGRSIQWLISGTGTSLVALLGLAPAFGVRWSPAQVPAVILLILIASTTTYCVGLFLSALVLQASGFRNIVSNVTYLLMMAFCGVEVPVSFWPRPVQVLADAIPLTSALRALRLLAAHHPAGAVVAPAALALAAGACWLAAAYLAFSAFARHGIRSGTIDLSE